MSNAGDTDVCRHCKQWIAYDSTQDRWIHEFRDVDIADEYCFPELKAEPPNDS